MQATDQPDQQPHPAPPDLSTPTPGATPQPVSHVEQSPYHPQPAPSAIPTLEAPNTSTAQPPQSGSAPIAPSDTKPAKGEPGYQRMIQAAYRARKRAKAQSDATAATKQPPSQPVPAPNNPITTGDVIRTGQTTPETGLAQREDSPACVRDPATGRFPNGRPRIPLCEPAGKEQYSQAKTMLSDGKTWQEVRELTGASRAALSEAAVALGDWQGWQEAQSSMLEADRAEIRDTAKVLLKAAKGDEWETRTDSGKYPGDTFKRSAALLDSAAGKLDVATHGRQAGRGVVAIQINNTVGQPPRTVQDW